VLTVGPQVTPKMISELKLKKILCATDLRPGSARVLSYAQALAKDEDSHLTLVHVLNIPADAPPERREAQKNIAMDQLLQLLLLETGPSVGAESLVEIGTPQERIPKVAEDLNADLIVMGPHHTFHPRISAHLPWAMLHHVLSRARCPVLRV
jgi:nucleotide-binding universal stress UspA family protein